VTIESGGEHSIIHHAPDKMKGIFLSVGLLAWLVSLVSATALTYKIQANERACFFAEPHKQGQKIAFYFAVCYRELSR
jgi:hypothetical protein